MIDVIELSFMLGMFILLLLGVYWLKQRGRSCPWQIFLPFLILSILALDGGLLVMLRMIGWGFFHGEPWPPIGVRWMEWYRVLPLALAGFCSIAVAVSALRVKPRLGQVVAALLVALVAIFQGLVNVRLISPLEMMELLVANPLVEPWTTLRAVLPNALVIAAAVLLAFRPSLPPAMEAGLPRQV